MMHWPGPSLTKKEKHIPIVWLYDEAMALPSSGLAKCLKQQLVKLHSQYT